MTKKPDYIVEDLRPLARDISDFVADPGNARQHDERNMKTIEASLRQFGQRKPIVVQKQGMIVRAGNGTLVAAKKLGWTQIAAVVVDEGDLPARGYAIADNRSAELASWNFPMLAIELDDLATNADFPLADLGWDDEVDNIFQADWEPPVKSPGGMDPDEVGKRHHIAMSTSYNEIFQRAATAMREKGVVTDNAPEGAIIAELADYWLRKEA